MGTHIIVSTVWRRAATGAVLLALGACAPPPPHSASGGSNTPSSRPAAAVTSYAAVLAESAAAIASAQRAAASHGTAWMPLQELASLYVQRAQLTGEYADYLAASRTLDAAQVRAGKYGVCLPAVRLRLSLHRVAEAATLLAGCPPTDFGGPDPEWLGLGAEIAFQRGQYSEALAGYRHSLAVEETLFGLTRLSTFHARTGNLSEASALLDRAQAINHSGSEQFRAWLYLQRGLQALARGRLDEAMALYQLGAQHISGWWLLDEHIAEVLALQGKVDEAVPLYTAAAERSGQPELMDALARLLRESPSPQAAQHWVARAEAIYRERLKLLPEATYGHATDHFLQFGEPGTALDFARRNLAARPNGEARIRLAEALYKAGQAQEALQEIDATLASGWNTAELHAIAAQLNAALGHSQQADAERQAAIELNAQAMRMYLLVPPAAPDLVGMLQ